GPTRRTRAPCGVSTSGRTADPAARSRSRAHVDASRARCLVLHGVARARGLRLIAPPNLPRLHLVEPPSKGNLSRGSSGGRMGMVKMQDAERPLGGTLNADSRWSNGARRPAGLTSRQRLFVQAYLVDLNAAEAARQAGYSAKTAVTQGSRLRSEERRVGEGGRSSAAP